jgi:hypothetical protein
MPPSPLFITRQVRAFRIAHMGDITLDELKELLGWLNEEIS